MSRYMTKYMTKCMTKRMIAGSLAVLLSILVAGIIAVSVLEPVYAGNTASMYYKGTKKCPRYTSKAAAARAIKKAVKKRKKTVTFYYKSNSPKEIKFFEKGIPYLISGMDFTKRATITHMYRSGKWNVKNSVCFYYKIRLKYYYTKKQEKKLKQKIRSVSRSLHGSAKDKIRQFDDYMARNCKYDYDLYYGYDTSSNYHTNGSSVYSALIKGKAVCNGYAEAGKAVLRLAGVKSEYVSGWGKGVDNWESHAWNIVKVGKNWYSCDFCWDSIRQDQTFLLKGTENTIFWSMHKPGKHYRTRKWKKKHPMAETDL